MMGTAKIIAAGFFSVCVSVEKTSGQDFCLQAQ